MKFAALSPDESGLRPSLAAAPRLRVALTGFPTAGKTTQAKACAPLGYTVRHADDLIGKLDWSALSLEVSRWFEAGGQLLIEGVAVPRALRKWLARHPDGKPCYVVLWMGTARQKLTTGQAAIGKGAWTVLQQIRPELEARGVRVEVIS
jgi:dephospho-CoA kinase